MKQPSVSGVVERRLLVNYRVDPEVAARVLPPPLRPQLVAGWAVAGICLIRLGQLRPSRVPARLGIRSENAAHRVAVEWDCAEGPPKTGVYIPRRDSASLVNVIAGGRLFPGEHHRAAFDVHETARDLHVAFDSVDGTAVHRRPAGFGLLPAQLGGILSRPRRPQARRHGAARRSLGRGTCRGSRRSVQLLRRHAPFPHRQRHPRLRPPDAGHPNDMDRPAPNVGKRGFIRGFRRYAPETCAACHIATRLARQEDGSVPRLTDRKMLHAALACRPSPPPQMNGPFIWGWPGDGHIDGTFIWL
jgi:hypothetical protein